MQRAISIGNPGESKGGFKNVLIRNCTIGGVPEQYPTYQPHRLIGGGIECYTADGGNIEGLIFQNIKVARVNWPAIRLFLDNNGSDKPFGSMRNIIFDAITSTDNGKSGFLVFSGWAGHRIENIFVNKSKTTLPGGGSLVGTQPDFLGGEWKAYSNPRAYGYWLRHVNNVTLTDNDITLQKPDMRPLVVLEDADEITVNGKKLIEDHSKSHVR
jgi:hypothetical protein